MWLKAQKGVQRAKRIGEKKGGRKDPIQSQPRRIQGGVWPTPSHIHILRRVPCSSTHPYPSLLPALALSCRAAGVSLPLLSPNKKGWGGGEITGRSLSLPLPLALPPLSHSNPSRQSRPRGSHDRRERERGAWELSRETNGTGPPLAHNTQLSLSLSREPKNTLYQAHDIAPHALGRLSSRNSTLVFALHARTHCHLPHTPRPLFFTFFPFFSFPLLLVVLRQRQASQVLGDGERRGSMRVRRAGARSAVHRAIPQVSCGPFLPPDPP